MIRNVAGFITLSLFKAGARIAAPTLAAGDVTVAIGAGAQNNVTNLPTADAAGRVTWNYTAAEANADYVTVLFNDVIGAEWEPVTMHFDTVTNTTIYDYLDATISGVPTAVWAFGVRTLTGFGTLVADITTAISAILCNVWNCARRTLTMPITLLKSMLRGEKLELLRGDTLDLPILALGDLTTATELWFTVKKQLSDADTASEIQISLTGGLLAIAGAVAATPANGSITIDDLAAGNVTIALTAEEMAKLDIDFVGYWDIQKAVGVVATTLTRGNAQVLGDSTRSV